jgi:transcriptional regulator with XRE-family HTH domain
MNSRILLILKTKNISASKFADEIGVQRSSISHILSGRNNPSLDFIQKTLIRFPDISPDWILTGKGSMYLVPDLFSSAEVTKTDLIEQNIEINDSGDDIESNIEIMQNKMDSLKLHKQQKSPQIKNAETVEEILPELLDKINEKKIERIVFFYSDKTCLQYIPE